METDNRKKLLDKLRRVFAESFPEIDLCPSCIYYAGPDKSCSTQSGVCEWVPDDVFLNRFLDRVRELLEEDIKQEENKNERIQY
jgi:hypothetical protein